MKRQSFFIQQFITLLFLLGLTILSTGYLGIQSLRSYAHADAVERQRELVVTLASLYEVGSNSATADNVAEFLSSLPDSIGYRITVITPDGVVLADTHEDASVMDNHGSRPEVADALAVGMGHSTRGSDTLAGEMLIYSAYFDHDSGLVFRVARTVEGLREGLNRSVTTLVLFAVLLIVISAVVSILAARRVSRLLNSVQVVAEFFAKGDFSRALSVTGFKEAESLSSSINRMGRQLQDTIMVLEYRQDELQSMLEGMTAPVVLLDAGLDIREINPAALELAGTSIDQCVGKGLLQIFKSPELYDISRSMLKGAESPENLVRIDREGGPVYLQVHASLIPREGTDRSGCLLVMNDVTRITQLEMMRKDFVANVSHELRTPITSILGFVETLRQADDLDADRRDDFLGIVHRQAVRLEHIIVDLMSLSRLEEGDSSLPRETVSVKQLFQGAVDTLAFKAESKDIKITVEAEDDSLCCVYPILAEQAVVNYLDNAIKYSPRGAHVVLKATSADDAIIVDVQDDGPGLPESEHIRIFERFHRVDKARSREMGGTGLGLAIVKHIALKHGGRAWVESRLGEGCSFRIAFPHGDCTMD